MKTFKFTIASVQTSLLAALFIFFASTSVAQKNSSSSADLSQGIARIDSAKTTEQTAQAAAYLTQLAGTDAQNWLAQYYAAYSTLLKGIRWADNEQKDDIYDQAMNYTLKADQLQPNNSEVYVLKSYITFMKMAVEPTARAMQMMPEAETYINKAIELNPENPRAYLIKGQNAFYTPGMFGGGKDVAKPILVTADTKFAKATINKGQPNWGRARCTTLLKQCE
jgi:tetratricopeptide (TPR) repeat protein